MGCTGVGCAGVGCAGFGLGGLICLLICSPNRCRNDWASTRPAAAQVQIMVAIMAVRFKFMSILRGRTRSRSVGNIIADGQPLWFLRTSRWD